MAVYLSMQRVRFCSPDAYDKFRTVFNDVRHHLMTKPGFIHLTWWEHPDEPGWYNEVSMWASKEALNDWHMDTYHKHAKEWAANGAIMEDIITNFELAAPGCSASARPAARCRTSTTTWRRSRRRWRSPVRNAASTSRWPRRRQQHVGVQGCDDVGSVSSAARLAPTPLLVAVLSGLSMPGCRCQSTRRTLH